MKHKRTKGGCTLSKLLKPNTNITQTLTRILLKQTRILLKHIHEYC